MLDDAKSKFAGAATIAATLIASFLYLSKFARAAFRILNDLRIDLSFPHLLLPLILGLVLGVVLFSKKEYSFLYEDFTRPVAFFLLY